MIQISNFYCALHMPFHTGSVCMPFYIAESFILRASSDSVNGLGHGEHMRNGESSGNQSKHWHASSCVNVHVAIRGPLSNRSPLSSSCY